MPHLVPEYQDGPCIEAETREGTVYVPIEGSVTEVSEPLFSLLSEGFLQPAPGEDALTVPTDWVPYIGHEEAYSLSIRNGGVAVRLTAPGYLDSTDWSWLPSMDRAREHVRLHYRKDPDTGEDLSPEAVE